MAVLPPLQLSDPPFSLAVVVLGRRVGTRLRVGVVVAVSVRVAVIVGVAVAVAVNVGVMVAVRVGVKVIVTIGVAIATKCEIVCENWQAERTCIIMPHNRIKSTFPGRKLIKRKSDL